MSEKPCVFCQIARGEKSARVLYEDEDLMAFHDIRPHAPVHLLIIPKKHFRSLNEVEKEDRRLVSEMIFKARDLAQKDPKLNLGYKLVFNVERGGGQEIFHLHMHLLGGW